MIIFTIVAFNILFTSIMTAQEVLPETKDIPKEIMNTLLTKFPKAEIHKWTKEEEKGFTIYDIEFLQDGQKFEADIKADGTIHNWEEEVTVDDLPEALLKSLKSRYPDSDIKEIMKITAVIDGKDELEGYEIVIETENEEEA